MRWQRTHAILIARNREFYRDRAGLAWNLLMPLIMVMAFAFLFPSDGDKDLLKIGVVAPEGDVSGVSSPFLNLDHIRWIHFSNPDAAIAKIEHHQLDLLLDLRGTASYWVNLDSAQGYLAERLLQAAYATPGAETPQRRTLHGESIRYVDWALPGVLAMNLMFSSLWGVGWVVVRYRKNGVLRRLKATPLSPSEFLTAQVLSRLMVVLVASLIVYLGAVLVLHPPMHGSYLALFLIYAAGGLCLISLGLIVSSRLRTEEVADGILNLMSWPMLLFSGAWFSMEGTSAIAQAISQVIPLTHLVEAARRVMLDGGGVLDILPQIGLLLGFSALFLAIAARLFRWE